MKHIFTQITLLAVAAVATASLIALTSCEDKKNQPWDPNAMVSLRPDINKATQAPCKANPEHLTPLEIVKQTTDMWFYSKSVSETPVSCSFADHQRDTISCRLLMWGIDVINADTLRETFIEAIDLVFVRGPHEQLDTIGYIPNSILRNAEARIRSAFAAKDYEVCYNIFDEAYRFIPITGAEWCELKAQGKN